MSLPFPLQFFIKFFFIKSYGLFTNLYLVAYGRAGFERAAYEGAAYRRAAYYVGNEGYGEVVMDMMELVSWYEFTFSILIFYKTFFTKIIWFIYKFIFSVAHGFAGATAGGLGGLDGSGHGLEEIEMVVYKWK